MSELFLALQTADLANADASEAGQADGRNASVH